MFPPPPEYIQFFPTLRCTLSCSFCFNRGIEAKADMDAREFDRLLSVMSEVGIHGLDLLGGEPTLHPQLGALIAKASGLGIHVSMSTNGTDIRTIEALSARRYALLTIGVSLNGTTVGPDLNAYIMRWKPLLKSVCGRSPFVPHVAERFLAEPDIHYYLLFRDTPFAQDLSEGLAFPEYLRRLQEIQGAGHENVEGVYCEGFLPDLKRHPALLQSRCPAGTTKLTVMPDGSAYPCYLLSRHREFKLGNIFTDDFHAIWESPKLDFFRTFEGNTCPDTACGLFGRCRGGCPAMALLINGDLRRPDPRCVKPRL